MRNHKAFTLLEILISVVVLAIGLVGVVAIFPAVIDLQRRAQDTVIGVAASTSAEAEILGSVVESESVEWVDWVDVYGPFNAADRFPVIDILKRDIAISERDPRRPVGASNSTLDFLWDVNWEGNRPRNPDAVGLLEDTGTLIIGGGLASEPIMEGTNVRDLPAYRISLADRLMPDGSTGADPRYVYDIVVRRVDVGIGVVPRGDRRRYEKSIPAERLSEIPIQISIFTRRIDRNIRLPRGVSLRDSLTGSGGVGANDRRFPLAVTREDLAKTVNNAKTSDTSLVYSRPLEARFQGDGSSLSKSDPSISGFDLLDPNELRLASGIERDSVVQNLTKVGQKFVDNQGVVRTVTELHTREVGADTRTLLVLDPPFSTNEYDVFQQIVFTPQVPVGVRVVTTR